MENIVSTLSDSHIRIRLDGDVISRCLLVTVALWLIGAILNAAPACLGLWVTERFLWTLLTLALLAAVAKSAVQVHHKGKAVLITGLVFHGSCRFCRLHSVFATVCASSH